VSGQRTEASRLFVSPTGRELLILVDQGSETELAEYVYSEFDGMLSIPRDSFSYSPIGALSPAVVQTYEYSESGHMLQLDPQLIRSNDGSITFTGLNGARIKITR
jgi:hypothetical protein